MSHTEQNSSDLEAYHEKHIATELCDKPTVITMFADTDYLCGNCDKNHHLFDGFCITCQDSFPVMEEFVNNKHYCELCEHKLQSLVSIF
ncbi:hypothetical protein QJ857_gp0314 [Tupanvirus soda lake]|uniref:Uncharacterized protein n=2 Tax=Tupanvirus TaxID=2094720 RepID=A0A6N1NMU4_9VIRU|nr:hypothetical protein QJ857_gp0314 [Tupanvirus soda lake]QKU35714.1 hypothetical protein [Tupanvirus soda lake]